MLHPRRLAFLAPLLLLACSPTPEDQAMMKKMMDFEAGQAAIIEKNPNDCTKLETDLKAYGAENSATQKETNAWWDGISKGKRKKLIDSSGGATYKLPMAMMKGVSCMENIKRGTRAQS